MPGRDGLALAAEIRACDPGMPLAVISANVQKEIVDAGPGQVGADLPRQAADEQAWPISSPARGAAERGRPAESAGRPTALDRTGARRPDGTGQHRGQPRRGQPAREWSQRRQVSCRSRTSWSVGHALEAVGLIGQQEPGRLVGVHQAFEGDISGRALLIFPETNSLELVRA